MVVSEFQKLNPVDPKDFLKIEEEIQDVLLTEHIGYAEEALNFLNAMLQARGQEIESKFPNLYDKYQAYWVKLAYLCFPVLQSADQDSLLSTRLLTAIQNGFEPDHFLADYYNLYESDDFIKQNFRNFIKNIEQNNEHFGTAPVEIEGHKLMPTLRYWIQDYSQFPSKVAKRGSVERLNYVNQSQNTRVLPQSQRQLLLKVLKFYDDLINAERPLQYAKPNPAMDFAVAPRPKMDIRAGSREESKDRGVFIDKKLSDLKTRSTK